MKVLLVYNPRSGNHSFAENLDLIVEILQKRDFELRIFRIDESDGLEALFNQVKEDLCDYNRVLVAGGDGTVNRVVNLLLKFDIDLPLGIYPVGTCNDFAKLFPFEKTIAEQTALLLSDNYFLSDVGMINDGYFINVASFGAFVDSGQRTDEFAKNFLGPFAYYLKAAEELLSIEPIDIRVEAPGFLFEGEAYFALILNGRSAGGFNKLGYETSINDGLLDVLILKKCAILDLPTVLIDVMAGNHLTNKNIVSFKAGTLKAFCAAPVGTDVDGEKGPSFPLLVNVIPRRLKIITKRPTVSASVAKKGKRNG